LPRDGSTVTLLTDTDLYLRGAETLLAAWEAIAHGSRGAAVLRTRGVTAGVFPHDPERPSTTTRCSSAISAASNATTPWT
jgi:hypothetical protein